MAEAPGSSPNGRLARLTPAQKAQLKMLCIEGEGGFQTIFHLRDNGASIVTVEYALAVARELGYGAFAGGGYNEALRQKTIRNMRRNILAAYNKERKIADEQARNMQAYVDQLTARVELMNVRWNFTGVREQQEAVVNSTLGEVGQQNAAEAATGGDDGIDDADAALANEEPQGDQAGPSTPINNKGRVKDGQAGKGEEQPGKKVEEGKEDVDEDDEEDGDEDGDEDDDKQKARWEEEMIEMMRRAKITPKKGKQYKLKTFISSKGTPCYGCEGTVAQGERLYQMWYDTFAHKACLDQLGSAAAKLKEGKSAAHSRANNFWFWRKSLRAMAECTCVFCQGSIERNDSIVWAAAMPQSFGKVKYCKQCFEELL